MMVFIQAFRMALLCTLLIWMGCGAESEPEATSTTSEPEAPTVTFTEVAEAVGLDFTHYTGAYGKKYFPETTGAGGGFLDYDGDGQMDLLLVNSKNWPSSPGTDPTSALYRNQGDGTFRDVTQQAGLSTPLYGMGMAAADYDNDGDPDLLLTAVGPNRFYRNDNGTFTDISSTVGIKDDGWSTSAMFFDYDNDGHLDLYVANYVAWSEETDLWCTLDGETKAYCTPETYTGVSSTLYRNQGDGTFQDVTRQAGVYSEDGKSLGVALLDFNDDDWLDLVVANDTQPDFLFKNNGDGTFEDVSITSGMALDENGKARAGMGIDVGVVDDTGEETLFIGNFANEMIGVYRDLGEGTYLDRAAASRIGRSSLLSLSFGLFLFDVDLDTDLDLFVANGHVQPEVEAIQQAVTFKQAPQLFVNTGNGRFADTSAQAGPGFGTPIVGRGAAYADYDLDGDLDVLVTTNADRPRFFQNNLANAANQFVRVTLEGAQSNRDGIGAKVTAYIAGKAHPRMVKTGSSFASQSELALTFGLGTAAQVDSLIVRWPSGTTHTLGPVSKGETIHVRENGG